MADRNRRKFLLSAFLVVGLAGAVCVPVSMSRTSKTEYCISCHDMKSHSEEIKQSKHAADKDKKPIQCAQCHIPDSVGFKYVATKTVLGMKDLLVHYFGDTNRLNRRGMQGFARSCHEEDCHSGFRGGRHDGRRHPLFMSTAGKTS